MFENVSQGLFETGTIGYLIVAPVLRSVAILFMLISTYKILKAREDEHKAIWLIGIIAFPFLGRIVYEIYCRFIEKKNTRKSKSSTRFLILSLLAWIVSAVLLVVSFISMGAGYIKSEIDGEPLATYYDVMGNEYEDVYDVPLHDKQGNTYFYESKWFTAGTYIDQNGNKLDGNYAYIDEYGYFYYDKNDELQPYNDSLEYYTDGETIYYSIFGSVYWEADGTMYDFNNGHNYKLFDFDE